MTFDATPPTIVSLAIASDHTISDWARVNSVVTLSFETDEDIEVPTVTISGTSVVAAGGPRVWTADYTAQAGDPEAQIPFLIQFVDLANNAGTDTTHADSGTMVTFDETPPTLDAETWTSDNAILPEYAKVLDTVTIFFTTNEPTVITDVTIATNSVPAVNGPTDWEASWAMTGADAEGIVPYTIVFEDRAGNSGVSSRFVGVEGFWGEKGGGRRND